MLAYLYYLFINFLAFFSNKKKVNFKSNEIFIIPNNTQLINEELKNSPSLKRIESKNKLNDENTIIVVKKHNLSSTGTIHISRDKKIFKPLQIGNYETIWIPLFDGWGFLEHRIKKK